jgi:hypothetical protein
VPDGEADWQACPRLNDVLAGQALTTREYSLTVGQMAVLTLSWGRWESTSTKDFCADLVTS